MTRRHGFQPTKPIDRKPPHGGSCVQKHEYTWKHDLDPCDVEQVYQLSQLLDLRDQALLLQHLAGSLSTKLKLGPGQIDGLYQGIVTIQKEVAARD